MCRNVFMTGVKKKKMESVYVLCNYVLDKHQPFYHEFVVTSEMCRMLDILKLKVKLVFI